MQHVSKLAEPHCCYIKYMFLDIRYTISSSTGILAPTQFARTQPRPEHDESCDVTPEKV